MILLHYPECWGTLCEGTPPQGTWQDSWRAFEHAVDQGKLRAIGEHMSVCRSRDSHRCQGRESRMHMPGPLPVSCSLRARTPFDELMSSLLCPGVSNFDMEQLGELRQFARTQPAVVQRNSDPFSQDAEMRSYCRLAGIQYQVGLATGLRCA